MSGKMAVLGLELIYGNFALSFLFEFFHILVTTELWAFTVEKTSFWSVVPHTFTMILAPQFSVVSRVGTLNGTVSWIIYIDFQRERNLHFCSISSFWN